MEPTVSVQVFGLFFQGDHPGVGLFQGSTSNCLFYILEASKGFFQQSASLPHSLPERYDRFPETPDDRFPLLSTRLDPNSLNKHAKDSPSKPNGTKETQSIPCIPG
eukprot:jgi/Psemu1/24077/gm1.24077_g